MFDRFLAQPLAVRDLASCFTCIGIAIASLEWLARPAKLHPSGLMSADCIGLSPLRWRWRTYGLPLLLWARLTCALLFLLDYLTGWVPTQSEGLFVLAAGLLCLPLRVSGPVGLWAGMNGAEHVMTANLIALGASYLLNSTLAVQAALAFVAARALIEYASAGATKFRHLERWASGRYLEMVFASGDYGDPRMISVMRRLPALSGVLSILVIAIEIAVPLSIVLPAPIAEFLLAAALSFHLGTATIMGLNTFVWAFAATYAPILYWRAIILALHSSV